MSEAKLDWSSAKVKDATLTVDIVGDIPSGWKDSFDTTARLLGRSGDWGEVSLKGKERVTVADVTPGCGGPAAPLPGERRRAVKCRPSAGRRRTRTSATREQDESDDDDAGPDAEMSDRFRSFAD